MFSIALIFCLLIGCFSYRVEINEKSPVKFKSDKGKVLSCVAEHFQRPITYQWSVIQADSNYTFPNSNHSHLEIKFHTPQSGYIVCQAKGRYDRQYFNSIKLSFYVTSGSSDKKVWIDSNSSPIHFKKNHGVTLTCKTKGFKYPISYQWIDVRNSLILVTSDFPSAKFVFTKKAKDGLIQCRVRDRGEPFYIPSKYVQYVDLRMRIDVPNDLHLLYYFRRSLLNMFVLTSIFCLFVGCFSVNVYISDVTPPVKLKVNVGKVFQCVAENILRPITYQWSIIQASSNYTFLKSNYSFWEIKFHEAQTGYIVCQARGRYDNSFYNSTKISFYVSPDFPSDKKVWIDHSPPINFIINRPKILTCKTKGFKYPISYEWIDVSRTIVLGTFDYPNAKFVFHQRVRNGLIQCRVRDRGYTVPIPSDYVVYHEKFMQSHSLLLLSSVYLLNLFDSNQQLPIDNNLTVFYKVDFAAGLLSMFFKTLIFCLFVCCFSVNVYIKDVTAPIKFKVNEKKPFTCVAQNIQRPITYQWSIIQAGSNFTFPNSNYSKWQIVFSYTQTGYIVCQAKGRYDNRFYNSTKISFYVTSGSSTNKKVWIDGYSPIKFKVNQPKELICKTSGITDPLFYQWIDIRTTTILGTFNYPRATFIFRQRVKDGLIQCRVRDRRDTFPTPSKYVPYQVTSIVLIIICGDATINSKQPFRKMSERNDHQTKKFAVRELQRLNFGDTSKFIKDWNPEISNRNKGMKLKRLQSYKDSANIKRFCPNDNSDKPKFDNCDCLDERMKSVKRISYEEYISTSIKIKRCQQGIHFFGSSR
uniref:Ig-like domain-containing protein n=1 Tax=Strigamia maritima TaxID=126957 RepID=T1JCS0_STRMM